MSDQELAVYRVYMLEEAIPRGYITAIVRRNGEFLLRIRGRDSREALRRVRRAVRMVRRAARVGRHGGF